MEAWRSLKPLYLAFALLAAPLWGGEDPFDEALHGAALKPFHSSLAGVASDHGENRVQFLFSFSYGLLPLQGLAWHLGPYRLQGLDFAYEGLFDFYLWTRHSQPLISRMQDPGLYFRFDAPPGAALAKLDGWQLGWFHESNGQVIDSLPAYSAFGPGAQDQVSRAWDYWYFAPRFAFQGNGSFFRLKIEPSFRIYTGAQGVVLPAEQDTFWRPQDPPSAIADYDGLRGRFTLERLFPGKHFDYLALSAELRTGYRAECAFRNWSKRFELAFNAWHLPCYLYYSNGFGPYISDYSTWNEAWGLGIRIW
jgi:hypothetical protein